ncbi:MAG TPA: hypothetical protein VHD15_00975 [Hyphomicrobiales bacterium]|nr:hypothetical protein [Hyphomicrobiales bacterium]
MANLPIAPSPEIAAAVVVLARPYLWWDPVDGQSHPFARAVAQVMDLGTYDDIRRLEALVEPDLLAAVMGTAAPGWLSPRSWEFWRGRLSRSTRAAIPARPRQRIFDRAPP